MTNALESCRKLVQDLREACPYAHNVDMHQMELFQVAMHTYEATYGALEEYYNVLRELQYRQMSSLLSLAT